MAFKASKKREKKTEPLLRGKPLIPSSALEQWYAKQIKLIVRSIAEDYRAEIIKMMERPGTKQYYAMDAALPIKGFQSLFERMAKRWAKKILSFSTKTAATMAIQINKHSFSSVGESLRSVGIKEPKGMKAPTFETMMETFTRENVALITNICDETKSKIERAVWHSLTAQSGEEQGAYGIKNAILKATNMSVSRAEFIAEDQNKKLYSALNNARMEQNGVSEFEWAHSSAGKYPRHSHVELDGQIFSTIGPPGELYRPDGIRVKLPKNDDGKPGHAIKCRCRAIPVIKVD